MLDLKLIQIPANSTDGINGVMDTITRNSFQDIHNDFAVAPDIHKKAVKTCFVPGYSQPEQMTVNPFQLRDQNPDVEPAFGRLDLH